MADAQKQKRIEQDSDKIFTLSLIGLLKLIWDWYCADPAGFVAWWD